MKRIYLTLLTFYALQFCTVQAQSNKKTVSNSFGSFRSVVVKYKTNTGVMGSSGEGTKTVWIDDNGQKEATLEESKTEMKIFGRKIVQESRTLNLLIGDWSYSIDLKEKTGTKTNTKEIKAASQVMGAAMIAKNPRLLTMNLKKFVEENGGKYLGTETFLGKICEVVELMGSKQWHYKGLILKSESNMGGAKMTEEAISIEENVAIPAERFKVPAGIEITEVKMPVGEE